MEFYIENCAKRIERVQIIIFKFILYSLDGAVYGHSVLVFTWPL